jgi:hypothetical protein
MKDKEFRPLLDEDWKKIKSISSVSLDENEDSDINWNYYISEPFPSVWPPASELFLIYYAYGEGFSVSNALQDGIIVSAPWARIDFDYLDKKVLKICVLTKKLIPIGSQSIQAMDGREIGVFDHAISLENYLLTKKEERSIKHLKDYYCLWIKHHKTLFNKIMPEHKEFTSWLNKKC